MSGFSQIEMSAGDTSHLLFKTMADILKCANGQVIVAWEWIVSALLNNKWNYTVKSLSIP